MRIVGPDELIFGVDNLDACKTYLRDYGLCDEGNGRFAALDGSAMTVLAKDDASLPSPLPTATMLRQTVWGVEDQAALDEIEAELSKDRDVRRDANGRLSCKDDMNFEIAFQVTVRKKLDLPPELINSPGAAPGRPANVIGANEEADALPRQLSHVVYFVPDMEKMSKFYIDRLGFVITDQFTNTGPFLRPQCNDDHHVLFMIHRAWSKRATKASGGRAVTSLAPTGFGTSTRPLARISNTMRTWTSTMAIGSIAKRRSAKNLLRCFFLRTSKNGRQVVAHLLRRSDLSLPVR